MRKSSTERASPRSISGTRAAQFAASSPALTDHTCDQPTDDTHTIHENGVPVPPRRLLGAYYTPHPLALILTRWALSQADGPVLDPSFGGCAFLHAAADLLQERGVPDPGRFITGVDIDAGCLERVRRDDRLHEENCVVGDFLQLAPGCVPGAPFAAIVGNPPYVRHHWLKGSTRLAARNIAKASAVGLPATASAWAYFLLHGFGFLSRRGRLAMLVPEAILQANYALPIREALENRFRRVRLIHLRDRLFEGTDESVVIVAASEFGEKGTLEVESVPTAKHLESALNVATKDLSRAKITIANGRSLPTSTLELVASLTEHKAVRRFSELATVRIGLVTGANHHFIRSRRDLVSLRVPGEAQVPIVARTKWLRGLVLDDDDLNQIVEAERRVLLVRPAPELDRDPGIQRWIGEGIAAGVDKRYKCSRRTEWFRVELPHAPDAFATCARLGSPLLVINAGAHLCSNALHAVRWKDAQRMSPHAIAVGFLTSLARVWAELHGRRYGGGVLKLEPSTLNDIPVPFVGAASTSFEEIDRLLRAGEEEEARRRADEVILLEHMQLDTSELGELKEALGVLSSERRPERQLRG